jgi:hypothetical protein
LAVIQESMPLHGNTDQEKIKLDIDTLDPATLWKLYIDVAVPKPTSPGAAVAGEAETNGCSSIAADYKHQQHS